jgi:hypothetical protein
MTLACFRPIAFNEAPKGHGTRSHAPRKTSLKILCDAAREIGAACSLSNLLQSEAAIDLCIKLFMSRLTELTATGSPIYVGD